MRSTQPQPLVVEIDYIKALLSHYESRFFNEHFAPEDRKSTLMGISRLIEDTKSNSATTYCNLLTLTTKTLLYTSTNVGVFDPAIAELLETILNKLPMKTEENRALLITELAKKTNIDASTNLNTTLNYLIACIQNVFIFFLNGHNTLRPTPLLETTCQISIRVLTQLSTLTEYILTKEPEARSDNTKEEQLIHAWLYKHAQDKGRSAFMTLTYAINLARRYHFAQSTKYGKSLALALENLLYQTVTLCNSVIMQHPPTIGEFDLATIESTRIDLFRALLHHILWKNTSLDPNVLNKFFPILLEFNQLPLPSQEKISRVFRGSNLPAHEKKLRNALCEQMLAHASSLGPVDSIQFLQKQTAKNTWIGAALDVPFGWTNSSTDREKINRTLQSLLLEEQKILLSEETTERQALIGIETGEREILTRPLLTFWQNPTNQGPSDVRDDPDPDLSIQ